MKANARLAKIHIAKQQLGMDDATYRAILQSITGVRSSKDLDDAGYDKVMAHFERCGFQPKPAPRGSRPTPPQNKVALLRKIEKQLDAAERQMTYADGIAKRMFGIEKVDWCGREALQKIVAALAYDAKRHGRKK